MRACIVLVFLALGPNLVLAEEPMLGPAIEGYGPTYPIDERDVALDEDRTYSAVFDAAAYADGPSAQSTRLVSVARFLNMHARNGTALENMDVAVVVHGAALKTLFNHEAYQRLFGIDNPNLELITRLHDAGVRFYVCGQSMAFGGYPKSNLADPAQLALSAMTMLTVLQNDGYALLQ
jgi:intracellular sulfur oxidation DsrE/DsrF family protein